MQTFTVQITAADGRVGVGQVALPEDPAADTSTVRPIVPAPRRPMRLGFTPKPEELGRWFGVLPTPAVVRMFSGEGRGLPNLAGAPFKALPKATVPHVSHKDPVPTGDVSRWWTAWFRANPGRRLRWTFRHEGEDYPWAEFQRYWPELRRARDDHEHAALIDLVNIHTLWASRYKRDVNWRRWMLPGVADIEGWDCYAPTNWETYEPAESLLGLPIAAAAEFDCRWSIDELGSVRKAWDTDGVARAAWFVSTVEHAAANGCESVALWCSFETVEQGGKKVTLDYRPHDPATLEAWRTLAARYP